MQCNRDEKESEFVVVIDYEFGRTDVCIIVVTDRITDKYFNHYIRSR